MGIIADFNRDIELEIVTIQQSLDCRADFADAHASGNMDDNAYLQSRLGSRRDGLMGCVLSQGYWITDEFSIDILQEHTEFPFSNNILLNLFGGEGFRTRIGDSCTLMGIRSWIQKPLGNPPWHFFDDTAVILIFFYTRNTVKHVKHMLFQCYDRVASSDRQACPITS